MFKDKYQCETIHAWGMTETSPLGTANQTKAKHKDLSAEQLEKLRLSQGRPVFGVELRLVDPDENNKVLPHDGTTQGNLHIRGHWIVSEYFNIYNEYPNQISFLSFDLVGLVYFLIYKNDFVIDNKIFYKKNKFKGKIGIFEINKNKISHILNFYVAENNNFRKIF